MNLKKIDKSVILITIDALRPDHLKFYEYHRNTTPNLERFCKEGTIFLNAFTNGPETPSAFSAIFTSVLPFLDGGYSPLPSQKIIFPQILKKYGIFTFAIHSNPNIGRFFNYNRGFDTFLDGVRYKRDINIEKELNFKQLISLFVRKVLDHKNLIQKIMFRLRGFNRIKNWVRYKFPILTDILIPFTPIVYNAPYIVNKLIDIILKIDKPFFIWAHFMDTHAPYNPPAKNVLKFRKNDYNNAEREFLSNKVYFNFPKYKITTQIIEDLKLLYDSEINFIDESLAIFLRFLKSYVKSNCLIIITADHGEAFYEHGFLGHQGIIFEELLKIPLIMVELGNKTNFKVVNRPIQLIDIPPTILDYFGIDVPKNFQGKNLLSLKEGELFDKDQYIISECYQKNRKIRRNRKEGNVLLSIKKEEWKYIFDEEDKKEFLFNLRNDPMEKINLINLNIEKSNEFRQIRDEHLQESIMFTEEKSKITNAIKSIDFDKLIKEI